eukprot:SM000181S03544  [mRNA]  locus=s181:92467:94140:+ [translate_table: standard]
MTALTFKSLESFAEEAGAQPWQAPAQAACSRPGQADAAGAREEGTAAPDSWRDQFSVNWKPRQLLIKFRQQVEGYRVAANFQFQRSDTLNDPDIPEMRSASLFGYQAESSSLKLVLKPVTEKGTWKLIWEPQQADVRLLSRKIPLGSLLTLQIGVGHDFANHTTGWKWKVASSWGGSVVPTQVRHKTLLPICPGLDMRLGWEAEYALPDLHGAVGMGEPLVGLNVGRLRASVERLEAIFTHNT